MKLWTGSPRLNPKEEIWRLGGTGEGSLPGWPVGYWEASLGLQFLRFRHESRNSAAWSWLPNIDSRSARYSEGRLGLDPSHLLCSLYCTDSVGPELMGAADAWIPRPSAWRQMLYHNNLCNRRWTKGQGFGIENRGAPGPWSTGASSGETMIG